MNRYNKMGEDENNIHVHVIMRDEKEGRKKQARSNEQIRQSNTAHSRQAVTFPKKNELPRVGLEPTTLYSRQSALPTELPRQLSWLGPNLTFHSTPDELSTQYEGEGRGNETTTLDRALYQLSYQGSSAGWAQISHFIVHLMNYQLSMKEKAGVMKPP